MEMLNRPKPGDNEDDVLNMQKAYLAEKSKNPNVQPAAKVINARKHTASTSGAEKSPDVHAKKSKFAEKRNLSSTKSASNISSSVLGEICERPQLSKVPAKLIDNVFYPVPKGFILGDIIEKQKNMNSESTNEPYIIKPLKGFPEAERIHDTVETGGSSIFAHEILKKGRKSDVKSEIQHSDNMEVDTNISSDTLSNSEVLSEADREQISQQNYETLNKMSAEEIEEERQKLLANLDPSLLEFLRKKVTVKNASAANNIPPTSSETVKSAKENVRFSEIEVITNKVLDHPLSHTWVHFDACEAEKLQWTTNVKIPETKLKPGETYEARFDFNGALLEYSPEDIQGTELYHHGEEPHRPGYSLKELFKLSRSQVQQQRVIALNCLSGILERHTLGGYWFLDLPIAKIFFVIRFAMDDNTIAVLQPALKAMRSLFWNHIDEACLDSTTYYAKGLMQPLLSPLTKSRQDSNQSSNVSDFINYKPEENEEEELTDYHVAENDIVQSCLRTDILPRIRYILNTIRPNLITVEYCLQILIRLARESEIEVEKILKCDGIMEVIINEFLPLSIENIGKNDNKAYGTPLNLALKLIRIIISHSESIAQDFYKRYYKIIAAIQCYLSSSIVVMVPSISLQNEAMNTWAVFLSYGLAQQEFSDMFPVTMSQLDYHIQSTQIIEDSSTLLNSHGAATLSLISHSLISEKFLPLLVSGLCNWCQQITRLEDYTTGHLRLVTSAFSTLTKILTKHNIQNGYISKEIKALNEKYILQMIQSKGFERLCSNIRSSSNLLSGITEKVRPVPCATQIGACLPETNNVLPPILSGKSPILLLESLTGYILTVKISEAFPILWENKSLQKYMKSIATSQLCLVSHWFTRIEYGFLLNIIKLFLEHSPCTDRQIIYTVSYKLSYLLSQEYQNDLIQIMKKVIFNKNYFPEERRLENIKLEDGCNLLPNLNDIFDCYHNVLGLHQEVKNELCSSDWNHSMLPLDWAYMPIVGFYSSSHNQNNLDSDKEEQQKDIIKCCLQWVIISETYVPEQTSNITSTDRFCRLLCVFLCHNSLFLDAAIKPLLAESFSKIFKIVPIQPFDFNKPLQGLSSFTDLYTQLLEHYQAVSYGDEMFSACVLVPLAQCHNICWRKQIWSEHAALLRVLNCSEEKMCYPFEAYINPLEQDESLLSCYRRALQGLLRPNTIPYKIANHHLSHFKK